VASYGALVAKHGTYEEFEAAVGKAVGEISLDKARLACLKYKVELMEALRNELKVMDEMMDKSQPLLETLIALGADPTSVPHPERVCHRCRKPNVTWSASSVLWNRVMRKNGEGSEPFAGIVCPTCFIVLAKEAGIDEVWRVQIANHDQGEEK